MSTRAKAILALLIATVGWGLSFPLMKAIVIGWEARGVALPSLQSAALLLVVRMAMAAVVMGLFMIRRMPKVRLREVEHGAVLAFFGGAGMLLQVDGLMHTLASTSAFLTQFYCALLPLWAAFVVGRVPRRIVWVCVTLVLCGVGVLAGFDPRTMQLGRGEAETLAAAVLFMGQILAIEAPRYQGNDMLRTAVLMFVAKALFCFPFALGAFAPVAWHGGFSNDFLSAIAILAVVCTAGSYGIMMRWQASITASEAGVLYCAEPVWTALLSLGLPVALAQWLGGTYPNEHVTMTLIIGGSFITAANLLLSLKGGEPAEETRAKGNVGNA